MNLLQEALAKVERPGVFSTYGKESFVLPGLVIERLGPVGLPLTELQAEEIKKVAQLAPFGKGMKTVVDTSVRNVWEVDASALSFDNKEWQKLLDKIISQVGKSMGVDLAITAYLYKLLIYEEGSFFLPHKDTEKEDRMFATLTITLPSFHQGGDLIVSHDGETFTYTFDKKEDKFAIQYAAFYADCSHEVKPVQEGFRLTLIYNLTFASNHHEFKAPQNHQYLPYFVAGLQQLREMAFEKAIIPLEHEYTEKNLAFHNLKNLDQARADLLIKAANETGFMLYLAFLHHSESGMTADDGYYSWEEYGDEDRSSSFDMEEVFDQETYIDHWIGTDSNKKNFGSFQYDEGELIIPFNFHDDEPYHQDYEGYAGNYGPTLEQVYRRAAFVMWPKEKHLLLMSKKGTGAAITGLQEFYEEYQQKKENEKLETCKVFAQSILDHWSHSAYPLMDEVKNNHQKMLQMVLKLDDRELLNSFIERVLYCEVSGVEGALLAQAAKKWGWNALHSLHNVPQQLLKDKSLELSYIIQDLCNGDKLPGKEAFIQDFFAKVIQHVMLKNASANVYENSYWPGHRDNATKINILSALFTAATRMQNSSLLEKFIPYLFKNDKDWDWDQEVLPFLMEAIGQSQKYDNGILKIFIQNAKNTLERYLSVPIHEPTDWVQDIKLSCQCDNCQELQAFMQHPVQQILRIRINKEGRQHLHQIIDKENPDLTHVTERKGSPYTLVCTKTRTTWQKLKEQRIYRQSCYNTLMKF